MQHQTYIFIMCYPNKVTQRVPSIPVHFLFDVECVTFHVYILNENFTLLCYTYLTHY